MSFFSTLFGGKTETLNQVTVLEKAAYEEAIGVGKVQLVDVRTANEFNAGHIKNAVNIDFFNSSNFQRSFEEYTKDEPVYLYCRSGARSKKASRKLAKMGFTKIYDLKGGYMAWK